MDRSYLLAVNLPLISATFCVTFFCLWRRHREQIHVLNWSLAYACGTLGSSAGFFRTLVDNPAPFSFAGNAFLVGTAFFATRGALIRYTGQTSDRLIVPLLVGTILGGLWFGFVEPSVIMRGTASSVGAAAMFLIAARAIAKSDCRHKVDYMTVATFALTAVMLVARPVFSFVHEGPVQIETQVPGSLWGVSFRILAMLSWLAIALLFLIRTAMDLMKDLAVQSRTDPLTGIFNRRGFFSVAERLVDGAAEPATILICDIDDFKGVNDSCGHKVGDIVIQNLARLLEEASDRSECMVGRLGGEEFVAFLPRTSAEHGQVFAEGIRTAFAAKAHAGLPSSHVVTISIGVATTFGGESLDSVLDRADSALYQAKSDGKNRVEVATVPLPGFLNRASRQRRRKTA